MQMFWLELVNQGQLKQINEWQVINNTAKKYIYFRLNEYKKLIFLNIS